MPHEDYCYALERENHALNEKYESLRQQLADAKQTIADLNSPVILSEWQKMKQQLADKQAIIDDWLYANGPNGWIESLRQQLAAALVACKAKDALAERAKAAWTQGNDDRVLDAVIDLLGIQPDDSALKAWLGEPVFIRRDQLLKVSESPFLCRLETIQRDVGWIPLYAPKGMPE